jgi:hypothetical protein
MPGTRRVIAWKTLAAVACGVAVSAVPGCLAVTAATAPTSVRLVANVLLDALLGLGS